MTRSVRLLFALALAGLPGCATTALWSVGWRSPGRWETTGAAGARAWCIDEGEDRRAPALDPDVAWRGWPEVSAPADPATRRWPRGPVYVVELAHDGQRTATAWTPGPWEGAAPAQGVRLGQGVAPSSARPVALRTVRAGRDGRALDLLVEDDGVAFVVSATGARWVPDAAEQHAHSVLMRIVLTPFALAWDGATLPFQLLLLPVILR